MSIYYKKLTFIGSDCYKYMCVGSTHFILTLFCSQGKDLKMRIGTKSDRLEIVVTFLLALVVTSPIVMAAIAVI